MNEVERLNELTMVETPFLKQLEIQGWIVKALDDHQKQDPQQSYRKDFDEILIESEVKKALLRLNDWLTPEQADGLVQELQQVSIRKLLEANIEEFNRLTDDALSAYDETTGEKNRAVRLIDFADINDFNPKTSTNHFLAISQYKLRIPGTEHHIIPDIVLFINGIPVVVVECKSPAIEGPIHEAIEQLLRYQDRRGAAEPEGVQPLFWYNQFMIATSGQNAMYSTITGGHSHYIEWKDPYPYSLADIATDHTPTSQEILIKGMLTPGHLLDLIQNFDVYKENDEGKLLKVVARYIQFRGTQKIIKKLLEHGTPDEKSGTLWHTQGSGKSLTMMFTIRKMYHTTILKDYKIVLLLDRCDLEKQLTKTSGTLKHIPHVAKNIGDLQRLVKNQSSDIIIGMIHKFGEHGETAKPCPVLNTSDKILVMIDEAHRTQYGPLASTMWKAMPNSVKIAFTGTPIDKTTDTFGGYIDTYTMRQALDDNVIVEIVYEGRATGSEITDQSAMSKKFVDVFGLQYPEGMAKQIDHAIVKGYMEDWNVIRNKASDMLEHYLGTVFPNGFKAQVVAYTREAAYRYKKVFEELIPQKVTELRKSNPNKIDIEQFAKLQVACIISSAGNNDEVHLKELANESQNEKIIDGFKMEFKESPKEGLNNNYGILIVQNMLLTGFDAPIEQVMYLDRVIRDQNLLQAIARVNRKCGATKQCGYIVDYAGIVRHLKQALAAYADAPEADTLGAMRDRLGDIDKLRAKFLEFMQFMRTEVGSDDLKENANKIIEKLVMDEALRNKFNVYFRMVSNLMDRVLPDPAALEYQSALKNLSFIRQSVANTCRDPNFSMKDASKKIRAIIEEYLAVNGIESKIPPVDILSSDFGLKSKPKSPKIRGKELEYGLKEYINNNEPDDPEYFERMAEKLAELLKTFAENWEALCDALEKFRLELKQGRSREENYGFDPVKEMPFFSLLRRELFGDKKFAEFTKEEFKNLKDLTTDILEAIKTETGRLSFWQTPGLQAELRTHIIQRFLRSYASKAKQRHEIAQQLMELAGRHYGKTI